VEGINKPDKVIITVISKLFICGDKVFKVYKHERFLFADLSTFESRKEFFFEDFFWNNTAAPEIYRHLWGVVEKDNGFVLVPPTQGTDFVIEMSRIDDSQVLTKLLLAGTLKKNQVEPFIDALVDTMRTLTKERRERLEHLFQKGHPYIMREDIESLGDFMSGVEEFISKKEVASITGLLQKALKQEAYFTNTTPNELSVAIDNNSDNLLLLDGKPSFIDILPPMEIWRVVDEYAAIARTIVDIEVHGGKKLGKVARKVYKKHDIGVPPRAKLIHELRAAGIQWSYRHTLNQHEIAEKFGDFVRLKMKELEMLL